MSTESLPRRIGKYELRQKLGQGGMGTVYRALEIGLHRSVAVKLMKSEYRDNTNVRQRFFQEARAVAALDHPNIIKIFYFDDEPELYLVMEFVPSGSLRGYLRHHQEDGNVLEVREALRLTRQIADALQVAHNQHMIHRDVKPDNVLLKPLTIRRQTTFHPLLTDFGLVKLAEDVGFQTQPGTAIGTYAYMSPEQLKGSGVDHRTDLYALGIMLYELVVGKLPFYPKTPSQAYDMHHYQEPPLPSDQRPGILPALENLILRAIAKNPNDRFQTALDMSEALIDIESGEAEQLTQLDSVASQGGQLESLSQYMTALPGTPVDDDVSRLDTPQDLPNDRVAIQKVGEGPIYIQMTRPTFIIGRTDDADITLPSTQVSRQHARINRRRDGVYTITDLGSTNRTFIDGVEILSDVPEPWGASQMVTIGEYRLTLQLAAGAQDTHPEMAKPSMEGLAFPSGDTAPSHVGGQLHTAADSDPVSVQLSPAHASVQVGSQMTVNLNLQSMTNTVEHFRVQIQGLPIEWVSVPPTALQLMPSASGSIPITFRPPLASTSTAGDHQYSVRVSSEERGMEIARAEGLLTIPAFHRLTTDMMPQRVTPGQIINITLENNGNSTEHVTINARDRAAAVNFDPPSASVAINPGQREILRIRPRPLKRKWLGTPEMFPLEVRATSLSGQEQIQAGELVVKPRLPSWIAGCLSLLLAGTLILGAYLVFFAPDDSENKADNASSTQEPSETPEVHDADGDGVRDEADLCPDVAGTDANGCPQEVSPPFAATSFTAPDCDSGTNIASIEALDQYTVQFTLCGPDPAFLNKIAFPAFGIQSSDYLEETGGGDDNLLYQPIGTGPYRLENWQRGFGITLTRFDNYWGDPAAMESLFVTWASDQASRWASIDGSDVDGIDNPPDDAASQLIQFYNRPSDSVFYIGLNNRFEPFNDERVRQALAMAIDREELVSLLPNSTLADQFMPPSVFGYTEGQTWYPYDPEFARALLEEAGYADGLYIDLYFRSVSRAYLPNPDEVMEYLASQLSEIGIEVNVVALDSSSFFEEVNAGELPMFALGWIGDYPDATAYLDFHFGNSSTQFFGDNDPEIAALLDEAAHTTNPDAREELYAVVNERIKELVPMIPIAHSSSSTAFNINVQNAHAGTIGIENFAVMNIDGRSRLNWMQSTEPTTLYCADEFTIDSMRICAQINETLVAYEIGGTTLTPHLATQWDVSDDGTAYTFYLREGVTFHDGSTLDANDVVSTFATQLDADHLLHVGHTGDFFFADTYFGIINQ